ncbi:hypothetical protein ACFYXF_36355 [Streptomyces sp. NPDC002680]
MTISPCASPLLGSLSSAYGMYTGFAPLSFVLVAGPVREINGRKLEEMG